MEAAQNSQKISKRTVDAAESKLATYRVWDKDLKGFGLKVTRSRT